MKKQNLYLLLFSILAACTDIDTTQVGAGNADHQVTACIRSISCGPRVSDDKTQTTFQTGDPILIGWEATAAYRYSYSGSEGLFTPADNNAKGLWSKLIENGSNKVDVYAWYDPNATSSSGTLPADNSTLSVKTDQSTEENYMSGLYMAAHKEVEATASTLEFTFQHLVSRIRLSIDFNDKAIEESDIQDAVVKMRLHASASIGKDQTSKDYQLTVPSSSSGPADDITFLTTTEMGTSHLDCICLLPPQSLDEKNPITIVLGKGKEYTCTLDKSLALSAGQEVALSIKIETEGTDIYKPVVTAIPKTELSSYYGNRLLCAKQDIQSTGDTLRRLYVYEKQADDSWGNPMRICKSLDSEEALALSTIKCLDICRDYVALGTLDTPQAKGQIYFCKRDKNTGKWYKVAGPIDRNSYAIAINEHFLVAGASGNDVTIYPITEEGEFDLKNATQTNKFAGFKLRLADNDIVCSSTSLYQLTLNKDGKVDVDLKVEFKNVTRASSSDGKKVILQTNGKVIKIYNIDTKEDENIDNPPTAGVGLPVAIYGDYALAGGGDDGDSGNFFNGQQVNWLVLLYYNGTKWIRIGAVDDPDSFLNLLKTYTSDETIQNVTSLAGTGIVMKGTRASITSEGVTYFVENIDKIVDAWLTDNP